MQQFKEQFMGEIENMKILTHYPNKYRILSKLYKRNANNSYP